MTRNITIAAILQTDWNGYTLSVSMLGRFYGWPTGSNQQENDELCVVGETLDDVQTKIDTRIKAERRAKVSKVEVECIIVDRDARKGWQYHYATFVGYHGNTGKPQFAIKGKKEEGMPRYLFQAGKSKEQLERLVQLLEWQDRYTVELNELTVEYNSFVARSKRDKFPVYNCAIRDPFNARRGRITPEQKQEWNEQMADLLTQGEPIE